MQSNNMCTLELPSRRPDPYNAFYVVKTFKEFNTFFVYFW